jgi:hypothetical protein
VTELFDYEKQALLDALRRDLRSESAKSAANTKDREEHLYNCRQILNLLDLLSPRAREKGKHRLASVVSSNPRSSQTLMDDIERAKAPQQCKRTWAAKRKPI